MSVLEIGGKRIVVDSCDAIGVYWFRMDGEIHGDIETMRDVAEFILWSIGDRKGDSDGGDR